MIDKKKNCIIYCRVSTPKQAIEGDSLEGQEFINRRHAELKGYDIVPNNTVFKEPFTGSKTNRPEYRKIIAYIKAHPREVSFFIIKCIDRFTREGSVAYGEMKAELEKYGVTLIDTCGIIQPTKNTLEYLGFEYGWSRYSPSGMSENLMADFAKTERREILTRLIGTEIELSKKGFQIGQPNEGYLNDKKVVNGKKRSIMIPDPKKAKFFIKMFEMRASGLHTDEEIVSIINKMGFKSKEHTYWDKETHTKPIGKKGNKPLTVKRLQEIIMKPIYCGVICKKWTKNIPIKAQFNGLVSIEIFNKANGGKVFIRENQDYSLSISYNEQTNKDIKRKLKYNPQYPFKQLVRCPECGKNLLGSASTGKRKKYGGYHCARGHKRFAVRTADLESLVEHAVMEIEADKRILNALKVALKATYAKRIEEVSKYKISVEENLKQLSHRQAEILEAIPKTTSDAVRESLEKKFDELEEEIKKTKQQVPEETIMERDIDNLIKTAFYLMEHRQELLINTKNIFEMHKLFGLVFDELPTYQDLVNGTLKLSPIFHNKKELVSTNSLSVDAQGFEPWTSSV